MSSQTPNNIGPGIPSGGVKGDYIYVAIISVAVFGIYLNAMSGDFVFDDWMLIHDKSLIHYLSNWKTILLYEYRPLRTLVLAVLFHFFGNDPAGYHAANVAIHILTTLFVFALARRLSGDSTTAFLASMIFGTHPIQTDAVSYISGIRDTLSSLFYIWGFYCFVAYREHGSRAVLAGCLLLYVLGGFTKEMAMTLVFMFFAYDYVLSVDPNDRSPFFRFLRSSWKSGTGLLWRYRAFYLSLMLFFLFMIYYYVIMRHASGYITRKGIAWHGGSMLLNDLTIPKIILYYLKQIVYPKNLIADYMYFPIVAKSALEPQALLSLLAVVVLVGAVYLFLRRNRVLGFSLAWFFIALLPGLNFLPHHEFMAEHYLYLPMAGVSIFAAVSFRPLLDRRRSGSLRAAASVLFGALILLYSARTVVRNMDWQNDLTLAAEQLRIHPGSTRTLVELGYLYSSMNLLNSSEATLRKALEITPDYGNAYNNLGIVYSKRKDYDRAVEAFKKAIDHFEYRLAPTNLGITLMILKEREKGKAAFLEALERNPTYENALVALFHAYLLDKEYGKAEEAIRKNIRYRPQSTESYLLLGQAQLKEFRFKEATESFETASRLDPDNAEAQRNARQAGLDVEKWEKVRKLDGSGDPGPERFRLRAQLNLEVGKFGEARSVLEEGLRNHPDDADLLRLYRQDLVVLEEYDKALSAAKGAVSAEKFDPEDHLWLAKLLAVNLRFNDALKEADRIASQKPDFAPLAGLREVLKKNLPLAERRERLEASDPDSPELSMITGDLYASLGVRKEALDHYRKISDLPGYSVPARYKMAKLLLSDSDELSQRDAIRAYREIIGIGPDETAAYNALGRIFMDQVGDFETAREYFQKSLAIDPAQPDAEKLKGTLQALNDYIRAVKVDRKYLTPFLNDQEFIQSLKMQHMTASTGNRERILPDVGDSPEEPGRRLPE